MGKRRLKNDGETGRRRGRLGEGEKGRVDLPNIAP